jgi:hypothetical protein
MTPDDLPDLRLTVRRGTVRIVDWAPWLVTGGPLWALVQGRGTAGVAIADVTVARDEDGLAREAIVRFLAGDGPAARETIAGWAADVGYDRLWFPDDVLDLPGPAEGVARARCTGCGFRFADGDAGFWEHVRESGRFPTACPLCGCDLPQWSVRQAGTGAVTRGRTTTSAPRAGT